MPSLHFVPNRGVRRVLYSCLTMVALVLCCRSIIFECNVTVQCVCVQNKGGVTASKQLVPGVQTKRIPGVHSAFLFAVAQPRSGSKSGFGRSQIQHQKMQRVFVARIDEKGFTICGRHDRRTVSSLHIYPRRAGCPCKNRIIVTLFYIALAAGKKIVRPRENQFGIKVFGLYVFYLVGARVFAVSAAYSTGSHTRQNFTHFAKRFISPDVSQRPNFFGFHDLLGIGWQGVHLILPAVQP